MLQKINILSTAKILVFVVCAVYFSKSSVVYAQGVCAAPPDYCIGTKVLDRGTGCSKSGNTCRTDYLRMTVNCGGSCAYSISGYECVSNVPNGNGQCPSTVHTYTGTCCVNSGGGSNGGCTNNNNCDPGEDPLCPDCSGGGDPDACGDLCAEGVSTGGGGVNVTWQDEGICSIAGLGCSSWIGSSGACDQNGENCIRVCDGAVCGGSPAPYTQIAGNVMTNTGTPISGVPIYVEEVGNSTNNRTAVTSSTGGWGVDLLKIGNNSRFRVIPLWTKNTPSGGVPFTPEGLKGFGKTIACTSTRPCVDAATGNNVPVNSQAYTNQNTDEMDPGGGGYPVGDSCGSHRNLAGTQIGARCNFVYDVVQNYAPTGTITALSGTTFPYTQTINLRLNASDVDANLSYGQIWVRKANGNAWAPGYSWTQVPQPANAGGNISCSGGTCAGTKTLDLRALFPNQPSSFYTGTWWAMIQVVDTFGVRPNDPESGACTGRIVPGITETLPAGWKECSPTNADAVLLTITPPPPVTISGSLIRVPNGNACTNQGTLTSSNFSNATLTSTYRETSTGVTRTGDVTESAGTFSITNVPQGSGTIGIDQEITPIGLPSFKYRLQCINGSSAGVVGNTAALTVDSNPEPAVLGYKLISKGWFTTRDGDVYAGFSDNSSINPSITVGIPPEADVTAVGFWAYLVNNGTVFGGEALSVKDPLNNNKYATPINRSASRVRPTSTWPASYDYTLPNNSSVINVSGDANCAAMLRTTNLNPNNVYVANGACINRAITNVAATGYLVSTDGIVVIHASDSTDIVFDRIVRVAGNDPERRILIVTPGKVRVTRAVGSALVLSTAQPHIQASIISGGGVEFEGTTDSTASPDTTVIIDGPIISGGITASRNAGSIAMNRDRGISNGYPSEFIVYNKNLIHQLTYSERNHATLNRTGLFVVDVTIDATD